MPTQKTRVDGTNPPSDDGTDTIGQDELEDLLNSEGLPADEDELGLGGEQLAEDPTGYVPPTAVEQHGGRSMRRMHDQHIQEAHERYAGKDVRITGEKIDTAPGSYEDLNAPPKRQENAEAAQKASTIMPEAFRQAPPPQQQPVGMPPQQPPAGREPQPEEYINAHASANEAAGIYEYLTEAHAQAEKAGDFQAAAYTRSLKEKLETDFEIEEQVETSKRHPVLQRFLSNLGIERIGPVKQEWGGSNWFFYPIPPVVDRWVNATLESALNSAAVEIAASTVGLDDVPLYEVLNVPLRKKHKVTTKGDVQVTTEITVTIYRKRCDCGKEIEADAEKCDRCGALHDKFDMPAELRIECASRFYALLESKFGPYEELIELVNLKDAKMKSRRFNKEDLYGPFLPSLLKESEEQPTTPESPSGEE